MVPPIEGKEIVDIQHAESLVSNLDKKEKELLLIALQKNEGLEQRKNEYHIDFFPNSIDDMEASVPLRILDFISRNNLHQDDYKIFNWEKTSHDRFNSSGEKKELITTIIYYSEGALH